MHGTCVNSEFHVAGTQVREYGGEAINSASKRRHVGLRCNARIQGESELLFKFFGSRSLLFEARPGFASRPFSSIFPMCSALWRAISPLVGRYRRQIPLCAPLGLSTRENSSLPRLNLEGFWFPRSSA